MPNLLVRNIPEAVYERLRERAAVSRRSLSGEIVTMLEDSLLPRLIDVEATIADAEAIRSRFEHPLPDLAGAGKLAGRRYDYDPSAAPAVRKVAEPGSSRGRKR